MKRQFLVTLFATLALSNVDKTQQYIVEQDTTRFLTLHLFKLGEPGSMIIQVNLYVLPLHFSHHHVLKIFCFNAKYLF